MLRYLLLLPALLITSFLAASPVAICEANVNVALPNDACEITLTAGMINAGSYEPNGASWLAMELSGHQNLGPGTYYVTLTVYSPYGTNSCWSTVLVEDKSTPTVTCTDRTYYLVAPDQPFTINTDYLVSVTDNCEPVPFINLNVSDSNTFGSTPFSATATDGNGNTGYCSGTITTINGEPQNYCSSNRNDYYEHISNITLGAINHSSGADGGYSWNYPAGSNTLYHGWNYNLSYTPGFRFSSTYQEYWSVYIDKNGDGDFTDSGELLHQWHGYGGNNFNFTSPGTYWGWSRIRVVMRYGGYATSPCGGGGYGETEDISVYLRPYFWFPWPGFRQEEQMAEQQMVANQELELGSARPVEEARLGEAAQRRHLISPEQTPSINTISPTKISVFPNPVRAGQDVTISGHDDASELVLMNMTGKVIKTYTPGTSRVNVPNHLPAGIYFLSGMNAARGERWTRRVVVK